MQTDSNVVSTLISSEQISEIATENRNFAALAALGLGVSSALPDSNTPTSVAANFTISVNGLRQSHNIWLIDGGEADDRGGAGGMDIMPSQDAIAEFNDDDLELSSGLRHFFRRHHEPFAQERHAEVPRRRCGSSTAHRLTTPTNFQSRRHRRPTLHYNIFGGNIGGPLFIPKVYNTNQREDLLLLERRVAQDSVRRRHHQQIRR